MYTPLACLRGMMFRHRDNLTVPFSTVLVASLPVRMKFYFSVLRRVVRKYVPLSFIPEESS
jgi:hypothetical protein